MTDERYRILLLNGPAAGAVATIDQTPAEGKIVRIGRITNPDYLTLAYEDYRLHESFQCWTAEYIGVARS